MRIYLIFSLGEWVLGDPFRGVGWSGGWVVAGWMLLLRGLEFGGGSSLGFARFGRNEGFGGGIERNSENPSTSKGSEEIASTLSIPSPQYLV